MANENANTLPTAVTSRLYLWQITALALALRFLVILITARTMSAHTFFAQASELGELAESLRQGHGLSSPFGGSTGPSAFLAPGYPLLVAALFSLFHSYSMTAAVVITVLQAFFAAGTVSVMMLLAQRTFGNRNANIAGVIWTLSPPLLFLPTVFWETSLSILLMTSMVALALACSRTPSASTWAAMGGISLCALAVNPTLTTVFVGLFIWTLHQTRRASRTAPILTIVVCLSLFALWPIRNFRQMHAFIPLRSNMGYELWQGNRPGADGFFEVKLHPNTSTTEYARYRDLGELRYMQEKSMLANAAIRANPVRFLALSVKRFACFWTGVGRDLALPLVLYASLSSLFGIAGLILLFSSEKKLAILFSIPLLLLPVPYYITHPDFRFRCVIDPLMVVLSVYSAQRAYVATKHQADGKVIS